MVTRKVILSSVLLALPLLHACKQKAENPATEYVGALKSGYEKSRVTAVEANLASVRQAVQAYRAANGSYPASLKDVEGITGTQIDPALYDYNPLNGEVSLKTSP
jgi:hypothetical protein